MDVQNFDIVRRSDVENTFRVAAIRGTFDLQDANIEERFTGKIELPDDWSIGIIVGNSGTGKTTIARELFGADYITQFEYTAKSVVDDMPKGCTLRLYEVFGVEKKRQYWKMFARYHYLSHSHNFAARVFIGTLNDEICLFTSILPFPHPTVKNTWKEHRTIVLPDYQGIGLSKYTTEYIAEMLKKDGKHYITTTSNPARIATLKKSPKFICTRIGRASTGNGKMQNKNKKGSTSSERITASFKYVG